MDVEKRFDIYNSKTVFDRFDEAARDRLLPENARLAIDFKNKVYAAGLMGEMRILKFGVFFSNLERLLKKPFNEASKDDLIKVVAEVRGRSAWKQATKNDFLRCLKRYYKIAAGMENEQGHPEIVSWIKIWKEKPEPIRYEDCLTWADVENMADHTCNLRDRAFIKTMWEAGTRIGEHLTLRLKDVEETEKGIYLHVWKSKTLCRPVFIRASADDLLLWIRVHPGKSDPGNPLFCSLVNGKEWKAMVYKTAEKQLKKAAERAKIPKKITPHRLRHGSVSYFSDFLSDSDMDQKFGWVQGSPMKARYVHKNLKSVEAKILRLAGEECGDKLTNIYMENEALGYMLRERENKIVAFLQEHGLSQEYEAWKNSRAEA